MRQINIRTVFLGIDVHKRTYSITAVSDGLIIKQASMSAEPKVLLAFIHKYFPEAQIESVYEAGFSGFGLHRFLLANGINNIVVHPASIEVVARNKSKTDKRDSQKMAIQLSNGRLHGVHVPSVERERLRSVTRLRIQYVKERTRTSCKLKSFLFYFGMTPFCQKGRASRKWVTQLLSIKDIDPDVAFSLKYYVDTWIYFDDKIKEIDKRIKEQERKDFEISRVYRRNYGIGLTSSRILANELGDLSQFNSSRQLYGFIGLTPSEHSSGDKKHFGQISRQGNPLIRSILTEAAWKAIKEDEEWSNLFIRIVGNTGSRKKAILGIARRMIGRIRAEFKKGDAFVRNLNTKETLCIK